jgi:hypothetical protein
MLTALLVSLTPTITNANSRDFNVNLNVVRAANGQSNLRVTANNPTNLDVCIPYGLPSRTNVTAKRRGKELHRNPNLVSARPVADCYVIHGGSNYAFDINLSEIYPKQPLMGATICLSVGWKYTTTATVIGNDLHQDDVCLVAP